MLGFKDTIGNPAWMAENREKLTAMFPETWTHIGNVNLLSIGFTLKLMGMDWRTNDEFAKYLSILEDIGIIKRDGVLIRRGR